MILPLLLALAGLPAGIALSFIAPEELKLGWKYFTIARLILFAVVTVAAGYFLWKQWIVFGSLIVAAIILIKINIKFTQHWLEFLNYLFFGLFYFLIASSSAQLALASLIFLYGLPAGTRLRDLTYEK